MMLERCDETVRNSRMRWTALLLLLTFAGSASAKGTNGNQGAGGARQPAAPPVDPVYQKTVDAMRAQAPDHLPVTFQLPSAAESLIAEWKESWDRPALLKERLEALWARRISAADRAARFHALFTDTASEPKLHDGIARFVRAHLPAEADQLLGPPVTGTIAPAH
jgi:hypothetical protein